MHIGISKQLLGKARLDFDVLRIFGGRAQGHGDVAGNQVAGNWNHSGVPNGAIGEDGDIGGTRTNIDQCHTQFALVCCQH